MNLSPELDALLAEMPASGTNLIISTRALTMNNILLINRYLKKDVKHG